jgi:hypothetical protein
MQAHKIITAVLWGSLFIAGGFLWLLDSLGAIQFRITDWWPAILIVIGLNIIIDGFSHGRGK